MHLQRIGLPMLPTPPFFATAFFLATLTFGLLRAGERPNLLFFLVDDMGIADTSEPFLYDDEGNAVRMPLNDRYRTPNIERLARQGRKFTNAHAYSVCTPTRTALLTGRSAERLRLTTWTHPQESIDTGKWTRDNLRSARWRVEGLDPALPTLARSLAKAGYRTIHCGKAHFGPNDGPAGDPTELGFDKNIAGHGGGGPGSYWGEKNYSAFWRTGGHVWDVPGLEKYHGTKTFLTEALTLELKAELTRSVQAEQPFFAYMAHYAVHAPFEADSRFTDNYPGLKGMELAFATLVEGMDKSLGDLLDHLVRLGIAEETLVIFYSDNGSAGPLNRPLRGKKGTRFEGGSRVPLIAAWAKPNPSHPLQQKWPIPVDSRDDRLVTPMDFLPTLLRLANVPRPAQAGTDGDDLIPLFTGKPDRAERGEFLVHFPHGRHNNQLFSTLISGDDKIIYQYLDRSWQFINLSEDPYEQENLVENRSRAALALAERMIVLLKERGANFPRNATTGAEVLPDLTPLQRLVSERENKE